MFFVCFKEAVVRGGKRVGGAEVYILCGLVVGTDYRLVVQVLSVNPFTG